MCEPIRSPPSAFGPSRRSGWPEWRPDLDEQPVGSGNLGQRATAASVHRRCAVLTQNVTQSSAGSRFRNIPTCAAMARPLACDLRKRRTWLRLGAGCFARCRVDRVATDQKVWGSHHFGRDLTETAGEASELRKQVPGLRLARDLGPLYMSPKGPRRGPNGQRRGLRSFSAGSGKHLGAGVDSASSRGLQIVVAHMLHESSMKKAPDLHLCRSGA